MRIESPGKVAHMNRSVLGSGPAMTVSQPRRSTRIPIRGRLDCRQPRFVRSKPSTVKSWENFSCAMTTCEQLPRLSRRCWSFFRAPTKPEPGLRSGIARHSKGRQYENHRSRGVEAEVGPQGPIPLSHQLTPRCRLPMPVFVEPTCGRIGARPPTNRAGKSAMNGWA